jgi:magnesium chelatase family protein
VAIVGLADKSVADSKERVRAALSSLGLALPSKRIAINLSPADVLKEGAHFDLPIAVALLVAMCVLPEDSVQDCLILGELSLSGSVKPVSGVLSAALAASASDRWLICPAACGGEAAWAGTIYVIAPNDLTSLLNHLRGALGAGKYMLAARLPGLLPALDAREALEVTMLHSVAGQLSAGGLIQQRPFRKPHHTASMAALVGGGAGKSRWPIMGFCFSRNSRNSPDRFLMLCGNRWKQDRWWLPGPIIM